MSYGIGYPSLYIDISPCYQGSIHDSRHLRSHYTRPLRTSYTTKYTRTSTSIRPHRTNSYCPIGSASSRRIRTSRSPLDTRVSTFLYRRCLYDNHLHNGKKPLPLSNLRTRRSRPKLEYTIPAKTKSLFFWYTTNLAKYAEHDINNVTTTTTNRRRPGRRPGKWTIHHKWRSNP